MSRPNGKRTIVAEKLGRKDKLTARVRLSLVDSARQGLSETSACALAGIDQSTLFRWKESARRGDTKFAELCKQIREAEAEFEKELVKSVVTAAKDRQIDVTVTEKLDENGQVIERVKQQKSTPANWQAAMRALERRYPGAWGKREALEINATTTEVHRSEIEVNATLSINVDHAVKYLDTQELAALEQLLEKIATGETAEIKPNGKALPAVAHQPVN